MSKVTSVKSSFTSGEIDPALYGRVDLRAYEEGAATLRNVLVQRTGGLVRRPGTLHVATVPDGARLFPYERGEIRDLLVFGNYAVHIVANNVVRQTLNELPWPIAQVGSIDCTLVDEAVLVCHPDWKPRLLRRDGAGQWSAEELSFSALNADDDDERVALPFARFAASNVALQAVPSTGGAEPTAPGSRGVDVQLRSTAPVFDPSLHNDTVIRLKGRQLRIYGVSPDGNGMLAFARTLEPLVDTLATFDWDEQAHSALHGWPTTAAMHQNRLVLGGCRERGDYLWFSRSGRPFNFDLADGVDDAAIAFRITAERRHEIRQLFSGKILQVFTTAGEWTIGGFPLTPSTARVELQTRVGSPDDRQLAPVDVDGATIFVGRTGRDLREFLFTDTEQAYQAADIAILSRHLMRDPIDLIFDQARRVFWLARADGRACAVTIDRNSNVVAWALQETAGSIRALTMHDGALVMLVQRASGLHIERLDDASMLDCQRTFVSAEPKQHWNALSGTSNGRYEIIADGTSIGERDIADGYLELPEAAISVDVGHGFENAVEGLPILAGGARGVAPDAVYRPIRIGLRLGPTDGLMLDTGSGMRSVRLGGRAGVNEIFDVSVRARGWRRGTAVLPWRLAQTKPMPFQVLSVTVEAKVNE